MEFTLELVCMLITATAKNVPDIVMNYIALACISQIDEIYYGQVRTKLKAELEKREFEIPITNV